MSDNVDGFKCVNCGCLFPKKALVDYVNRNAPLVNLLRMKCPVCDARFTDGKLGQEFHGQSDPPSIRDVFWPIVWTANPDDR